MYKTRGSDLTVLDDISGNYHHVVAAGTMVKHEIDILSVDRMDPIPGLIVVSHFSIFLKQVMLSFSGKTLSLIEGNFAAGPYTLEISEHLFKIIDNWTIQLDYSYALDSLTRCDSLTWIDGLTYSSDTIVYDCTIGIEAVIPFVTLNLTITDIDTSVQQIGMNLQAVQDTAIYPMVRLRC